MRTTTSQHAIDILKQGFTKQEGTAEGLSAEKKVNLNNWYKYNKLIKKNYIYTSYAMWPLNITLNLRGHYMKVINKSNKKERKKVLKIG